MSNYQGKCNYEVVWKNEEKNLKDIIVMFCNFVINEVKLIRKNNK